MKDPFRRFLYLLLLPVFLMSCRQELVDFFEAIQDYGYRSVQPLGPNKTLVNENMLGGYVYDGLPVIISKKNETTYEIRFLSVLLHKEDAVVEAHATQIGTTTFLNLNMGDYYCIMRANLILSSQLQIDLLREELKEYIAQDQIRSWLEKNPGQTTYVYDAVNDYAMDVYYSFVFEKVTVQSALQIQKDRLREERRILFENCSSYAEYESLIHQYPNDEFIGLAEQSLLESCKTIEELREFIAYFPDSHLIKTAEEKIRYIAETERLQEFLAIDQNAFLLAKKENSIDAMETFREKNYTSAYDDSATAFIAFLATSITRDEVEWKWTNGDSQGAITLLNYKIDYLKNLREAGWIIELITLYTLKMNNDTVRQNTLNYYNKLVERKVYGDAFLDLYLGKGFVLWSANEIEVAIRTFELKLQDVYEADGLTFQEHIKLKYNYYVEQGIQFPDQKYNWKRIKKLKPLNE